MLTKAEMMWAIGILFGCAVILLHCWLTTGELGL